MLNMVSNLAPAVVVLAIFLLIGRHGLFSWSPAVIAAQLIAVALSLWARMTFRKSVFRVGAQPGGGSLLTSGPYRFIRHPMYAAAMLFVWAGILGSGSALNVAIGLVATAAVACRIAAEERLLRDRYAEYGPYSQGTKHIFPFVF